ncbi:hypothetical protein ALP29_200364 [Pseudomonas syringae pv. avii]|uniref:Uncharacterized protein n=1 Tax=Pseudomonas syringae pv. avii TaxID=663959 RepID=A0A3M5UXI0_PSESX|nr:hypothetical protein PLA106_18674 [Pseudomonas amygdali pv. lachrymans str. M302278]RMU50303.1 hypothetical protein ALP29_200364 [Pseudomonas syringae pv. avii]
MSLEKLLKLKYLLLLKEFPGVLNLMSSKVSLNRL